MKQAKKLTALPDKYEPGFIRRLDRRMEISQRIAASYDTIVADAGGYKLLSHVKLSLIERFVFLEAVLQSWELVITTNPKAAEDLVGKWIQASNALQGIAAKIGLERSPAALPSLKAYVAEKA